MQKLLDNSGIILINKPVGVSSRYVTNGVMRAYGIKKAGHTGTLDKLASGMLPICLGQATKYASYINDADKCYTLKALFGYQSSTGDMEGECLAQTSNYVSELELTQACSKFIGKILQVPPMYSALKHQGQPLYKLARSGVSVPRAAREIEIFKIELIRYDWPWVELKVECSKGTYIRTLVEDLAKAVGVEAYLVALHRDWIAGFKADAKALVDFAQIKVSLPALKPIACMLSSIPRLQLTFDQVMKLRLGQHLEILHPDGLYAGFLGSEFIGIIQIQVKVLRAKRLMATINKNLS